MQEGKLKEEKRAIHLTSWGTRIVRLFEKTTQQAQINNNLMIVINNNGRFL